MILPPQTLTWNPHVISLPTHLLPTQRAPRRPLIFPTHLLPPDLANLLLSARYTVTGAAWMPSPDLAHQFPPRPPQPQIEALTVAHGGAMAKLIGQPRDGELTALVHPLLCRRRPTTTPKCGFCQSGRTYAPKRTVAMHIRGWSSSRFRSSLAQLTDTLAPWAQCRSRKVN